VKNALSVYDRICPESTLAFNPKTEQRHEQSEWLQIAIIDSGPEDY
jgi:hypothetical protein